MRRFSFLNALLVLAIFFSFACARSARFDRDIDQGRDMDVNERQEEIASVEKSIQPKKKILILPFWNDTPQGDDSLGVYAKEEIQRRLLQTRKVIIPQDLETSIVTRDFVSGDQKVQVAQLVREGRRLGVHLIMIGRISKLVFRTQGDEKGILRNRKTRTAVDLELKLFDVQAGREVASIAKVGQYFSSTYVPATGEEEYANPTYRKEMSEEALRDALERIVPDVSRWLDKLVWQGKIAKILGQKIYINSGKSSGLMAGDILKVLTPGDDIYDPVSKAYLGRAPGQLKGTLEVTDFLGQDGAITEVHSGGNFQEGDAVLLY